MKTHLGFFIALFFCAVALHYFPYNETNVAKRRLERLWSQDSNRVRDQIADQCRSIHIQSTGEFSKIFSGSLGLPSSLSSQSGCELVVHHAQLTRFQLTSLWQFAVQIRKLGTENVTLLERRYPLNTPRPLVLLPILAWLFAVLFEVRFWKLSTAVITYLLLLGGGSPMEAGRMVTQMSWVTIRANQTFWGFVLLILWLAILKTRLDRAATPKPLEKSLAHSLWNRGGAALIGLWNPVLLTLFGQYLTPLKTRTVQAFLNGQALIACLSLYLLSFGFANLHQALEGSLLLPRYFTFTMLVFFIFQTWASPKRFHPLWKLPNFVRAMGFIALVEIAARFLPQVAQFNSVFRVGLACALSECLFHRKVEWKQVFPTFSKWSGVLFISFFITTLTQESGLLDVLFTALDPHRHPTYLAGWTFIAGGLIGFVTGSFSVVYFLFVTLMETSKIALIHGALLDGILAGCLLSPFSIFNLLPATQFGLTANEMVRIRAKQLGVPITLGLVIFTLGAIHSVAILRPVAFIFGCLVVVTLKLKNRNWSIRRRTFFPTQNSA